MSHDDPFGEPEKTIIRPNPGGRRAPAAPAGPGVTPQPGPASVAPEIGPRLDLSASALNRLVGAATPILSLATRLRTAVSPPNLEALRERIAQELRAMQERIAALDMPVEAKRAGSYAVCATIDDVISNTPWGSGRWPRQAMVPLFFNEASGGERFFQLLTQYYRDPGRYGDLLELMYLCLSLGFEGRLRVAGGSAELHRIREGLYNTLRQRRDKASPDLSPRWRGIEAPHRPLTSFLPGWVVLVAAAAIATLAYAGFYFAINRVSDSAYETLAALPPTGTVTLQTVAPAPPPPVTDDTLARLKTFLAPEIREGLVVLTDSPRSVNIRLVVPQMFASGSADVESSSLALINRVATALDAEPGAVLVVGHTDNVPIRSLRFPSNYDLSRARALSVAAIIKSHLKAPARVTSEGRGDTEPLVPNDSPAHRAENRRIEIILSKQPLSQEAAR